uniref:Golgin B1 n=1 Tax=Amphilophus citrinellus TaxID=61819 RepID=A0A3Q0QY71_AMPCI
MLISTLALFLCCVVGHWLTTSPVSSQGSGSPPSHAGGGEVAVEEMAERLTQTEQLVTQLKEMIREKDAALRSKDDQLKAEKEACEAKLSKLRLQNKAKVTSLTTQLEELKKQQGGPKGGEQASRGKIVLLKKKVDELEQQLAQRELELENKKKELESQRQRGEEMDAMLTEKDRKLAEKEAYIVHLQTALAGEQRYALKLIQNRLLSDSGAMQELQLLVQSLTKKVGEAEERYSLLQEQTGSLKELLATEKEQYSQKESMYKQNIQTFKDIIIQKDSQLMEINQMHEQELFKLAAKSDASADLEQLLKALKQKLHEKEEVLLGKTQVIDVLQGEVDGRDQQIKELSERLHRLQVERESLESRMEAEKHVMRAQLRDLMDKQQAEVQRMTEQHQAQMDQTQQDLMRQLEDLRRAQVAPASQEVSRSGNVPTDSASIQRIAELEAQAKQKTDEASRSEAKFLKMKAWSKSRIRQLEEELKKSQVRCRNLTALRSRITTLEEEREENLWKVEQYEELKAKNEMLEAKLVVYEEQQRTLQADLEQFTKRAASQASESGSIDDTQSQVLEWQEMVAEAVSARDRAREEKADDWFFPGCSDPALVTRQQELEEELAQARGLSHHRAKKLAATTQRSLQEDFELDGQDLRSVSESTTPMEGENMGDGLRSVVEELELERNQLQEQILILEERCQDLEDRLQLQARIEALQNESEKLQSQLATVRSQQSREAEKHQLLVNSLNEQLKGLTDTQECLESSLIEKENTLAKTSEKLELINSLRESLSEKDIQCKELSDKLLQTEHTLENISMKCTTSEKQCSELKTEVMDVTQKLSVLKEKAQKQEITIETMQTDLDQTNEELDKLNSSHLEERAQLIHDLQSCEREIDILKDALVEKDKEISTLVGNMAEYAEQVTALKQEIKLKDESLVQVENALRKAEREADIMKESQNSDQQTLNSKITELVEKIKEAEMELVKVRDERESKVLEVEHLIKQAEKDKTSIRDLRAEIQKQTVSHHNHLSECETCITSLKEQLAISAQKLQESEGLVLQLKDRNTINDKLQQELNEKEKTYEKELKSFKEEQNKLLAQVEKYRSDVCTLSKQLEEQVQSEQSIKQTMQEKMEMIASLENQLKQVKDEGQKFNTELQLRDSENEKLCTELQSKSENISTLECVLKSVTAEMDSFTHSNSEILLAKTNECSDLQQLLREKEETVTQLQEQVQTLMSKVDKMHHDMVEKEQNLTELQARIEAQQNEYAQLQETLSLLQEQQNSLKSGLLEKDREEMLENTAQQKLECEAERRQTELASLNSQIQAFTEDNCQLHMKSVSELSAERDVLQEKTCGLEIQISDSQKIIAGLLKEKEELAFATDELKKILKESEQANSVGLLEKTSECANLLKALREKDEQFQSLQEQVDGLKMQVSQLSTSLVEKEQTVSEQNSHIKTQQNQLLQLQDTISMLQEQGSECSVHQKEVMLQKDQLGAMNESAAQMEVEITNLKASVQKLTTENCQLIQEDGQRKAEITDFKDNIQAFSEQNARLKSELQKTVAELSKAHEEVANLKTAVCDKDSKVKTAHSEKEILNLAIQGKDDTLKQQENLIQQLSSKIAEQEEQIKEKEGKVLDLTSESSILKNTLEKKEQSSLEYQSTSFSKALQNFQQRADEALHFKTQFMESTDLASQLQSQIQLLSTESEKCRKAAEETQSAFNNLQEKYAANLEELQDLRKTLFQKADEVSNLQTLLDDSNNEYQTAKTTIETLRNELSGVQDKLEKAKDLNSSLSKEKDDALTCHQTNVSLLTVEIERLKSQHLQVVAQMNALTENLEQREMALHAINSQYIAQSKDASQLVSEMQKLEEQNKRLNEEIILSKEEHHKLHAALSNENTHLKEEFRKLFAEKEELEERHQLTLASQRELQVQMEQTSSSMNELMTSEKQNLQAEVSAKEEDIFQLKENIQKIEQILQDSEKEWLLVLDREKQEKNLFAEQLKSVENEIKSKDDKVNALKQDLDSLQEKLAEASAAIREGSDQLSAKELEASASRIQLENVLTSIQEKENENHILQQALKAAEDELQKLVRKTDKVSSVLKSSLSKRSSASLKDMIKQLQEDHQNEMDALEKKLTETVAELERTQNLLKEREENNGEKGQQIALLQETVEHLRTQLNTEIVIVKEATVKHSSLSNELQTKDEQISCMTIHISQQKELLAGLTQQIKEKDASIAQVMESASNERMKLGEENSLLLSQLKSTEQAYEEISQQLEKHISHSSSETEKNNLEKLILMKGKDELQSELTKVSKEKDAVKKKLQAALIVRKDLLRRIEEYENQKEASVSSKTEVSLLQNQLDEATNQAQAAAELYKENVSLLEKKILEKEEEFLEHKTENERFVGQLESMQTALNGKEAHLSKVLQKLSEKDSLVKQLESSAAEKEEVFEQDRNSLLQKLEELQNEIKTCKNELKDKSAAAASAVDLENELARVKSEKATLQKKAQAALLARKESMKKAQENEKKLTQELAELKDDYKALLEQHCQQTNELNAVQLSLDEKTREMEDLHKTSFCYLDELETLRQLVEERDKTLQDLKMSLAEKESQCHSLSSLQTELEATKSRAENISLEMASKDETLIVMEQKADVLKTRLQIVENELREKTEEVDKYRDAVKDAEAKTQQDRSLFDKNKALETQLNILKSALEEHMYADEKKYQILMKEKEAVLEQSNQMKAELETLAASVLQKSLEVSTIQKTQAQTEQQLTEEKHALAKELENVQLQCTETQRNLDSLKQEKESFVQLISELRDEVTTLRKQLNESEEVNEQLLEKKHEICIEQELHNKEGASVSCKCAEIFDAKLKERDDALLVSQTRVSEKDELIAALELQLQQQIKMHEIAVEKMRRDNGELQKSHDDARMIDQDNQSKIALLTRKLQAALVSRKELMKENTALREEAENLSAKHEGKEAEYFALQSSLLMLKQQNLDLEGSVSSVSKEKVKLSTEVDSILNENRSLSAACESLKLTIENITQQKQAFSCQLESLKDSQTEELSKWKSKHAELKQEYESLLEAYENVSSEMDKMRQLLEGAKRDRQEALRNVHKHESELEILGKQAQELEEENERMKQRIQVSKEKWMRIEALEKENEKIRKELMELDRNHKMAMCDLSDKNQQLEAQSGQFKESLEALRVKLTEREAENLQLAERLEEATCLLEKKNLESNTYTNNMQVKLDEALSLNSSLTAQIEAQKTELGAQMEINNLVQKEKQTLSERIEKLQNDYELQLGMRDDAVKELKDIITRHSQETISLNEKVRILEDDKSLLQEELENVQEISDKVKNENEYLETVILKNSERIDELTESISALQSQNTQLSNQLASSKEMNNQIRHEKEQEQLKLVKDFEEKLKTVQRGSEGSKTMKKELQELLKEKHQEINQLQQNCIKYQELILDLESSLKSSQSTCEHLEKELKKNSEKMADLEKRSKQAEAEVIMHKRELQEAKEKIESAESERDQLALQVSQQNKQSENQKSQQSPQNIEEAKINSYMENQFMLQQQIEDLTGLKEKESQKVDELRQQLDSQDLQINTLKRLTETYEAKLSALASTPQGADATKCWNDLYQKTLHEKDNQLIEQGFIIKRFLEDMRMKDKEVNELRVTKSRLERMLNEYSVAAAAHQRQLFVVSASNAELSETAELLTMQVKELSAQLSLQQTEKINADMEAQLFLLQSQNDKIQADFQKQEGISLQLKTLLQSKDAEISSLLSCKDGQMSGYLEQLQANYRNQVLVYEDRLTSLRYQKEKADKELRVLEAKTRSQQMKVNRSVQEKEQMEAKMESFKNSMVSLQSERERLMSEYRILEAKSQLGLKGKEGSPDGEGGAAKGLKHEIRKLLHQMDDLNSENAMLRAQLVRYREDLNQVLSLKDNQLKVLLKKQQEVIKDLETQKAAAEKHQRESRLELQKEEEASCVLKAENCKLKAHVSKLEAELLTERKERASTNWGKVIADLQEAVATKASEYNDLQQKLLSQKLSTDELKDKMQQLENETDKKLAEAEDKYNGELDAFEREVELMRTEREIADQRLAELAKDLLETEQQLSEAKSQSKDAKAQNESLCKAMAALQNDRDQLIEDFKVLRQNYDEELRGTQAALNKFERSLQDATSDLAMLAKERDILIHKLKAFESKDVHAELNKLLDELSKALSEKERELKKVVLENNTYSRQLSAFSGSMASLQNDRERLMDELAGAKRVVESRQGSSPETVSSVEKSKGSGVSALETESDGLVSQVISCVLSLAVACTSFFCCGSVLQTACRVSSDVFLVSHTIAMTCIFFFS